MIVATEIARVASLKELKVTTAWQADSAVTAHALLNDGTLIVTLRSGHVFCLKLHHGARRITLAELNTLYEQQAD